VRVELSEKLAREVGFENSSELELFIASFRARANSARKIVLTYKTDGVKVLKRYPHDIHLFLNKDYGKHVVAAVSKHEFKALDLIKRYKQPAARAIDVHGERAMLLIDKFGGEAAAKAIDKHGERALKLIEKFGSPAAWAIIKYKEKAMNAMEQRGAPTEALLKELRYKGKKFRE
jgi:hypothetical protein